MYRFILRLRYDGRVFKSKALPQPELFVPSVRLVQPATSSFYTKLEQTLDSFGFSEQVRQLCAAAYSDSSRGRPGVDPAVYFKMLMIGFFENIPSERGIAERCNDSISIRFFLGYDLTQSTSDIANRYYAEMDQPDMTGIRGVFAMYPTVSVPAGWTETDLIRARRSEGRKHHLVYLVVGDGARRMKNEYWPETVPLTAAETACLRDGR